MIAETPNAALLGDEDLMLRVCQLADQPAFSELVHRYAPELTGYLRRFTDANAAEDLTQMTFAQAYEHRHQFHPGKQVRPWLYGIATHLAIDAWRKSRRRHESSLEVAPVGDGVHQSPREWVRDEAPTPDDSASDEESRERVRTLVTKLPEHLRSVVMLIHFQGLKYTEAAEALQVPIGTIKSRLYEARKRIRQEIACSVADS